MKHLREIILLMITGGWLLFVATNVNIVLGQTYASFVWYGLMFLIIGLLVYDKKIQITFQKEKGKWAQAILYGAMGTVAVWVISSFIIKDSIGSVIRLLGASTPALAQSKIANLITFGGAIAFIETQVWARAMEFIADILKININKESKWKIQTLILIGILAGAFTLFHLTAKGITNIASLWVVFVMMLISLLMVIHFQETRQAVFLHIIANSIASYIMLFT